MDSVLNIGNVTTGILLNTVYCSPWSQRTVKGTFSVPALDPNNISATKDTKVLIEKNKSLKGSTTVCLNNSITANIPHYMFQPYTLYVKEENKDLEDNDEVKWSNFNSVRRIPKGTKFGISFIDGDVNQPCVVCLL